MKNGTLIRQVLNKINEIDFNRSEDRHLFGDIYEQILKDLQSAGNSGEYYTPRAVTQFMSTSSTRNSARRCSTPPVAQADSSRARSSTSAPTT